MRKSQTLREQLREFLHSHLIFFVFMGNSLTELSPLTSISRSIDVWKTAPLHGQTLIYCFILQMNAHLVHTRNTNLLRLLKPPNSTEDVFGSKNPKLQNQKFWRTPTRGDVRAKRRFSPRLKHHRFGMVPRPVRHFPNFLIHAEMYYEYLFVRLYR
jgi:hypothetical protein